MAETTAYICTKDFTLHGQPVRRGDTLHVHRQQIEWFGEPGADARLAPLNLWSSNFQPSRYDAGAPLWRTHFQPRVYAVGANVWHTGCQPTPYAATNDPWWRSDFQPTPYEATTNVWHSDFQPRAYAVGGTLWASDFQVQPEPAA